MTAIPAINSDNRIQRYIQLAIWVLFGAAVIYGLVEVIRVRWVCDDAFISFRYARNLVNGLGLVFNASEHVEGYTNFLWTIIIAGGMLLKLNPVPVSMILGGLSYFATIGILAILSSRLIAKENRRRLFFPIAALTLLLHHECHVYATSGLETMWTTALVTLGFVLLVLGRTPRLLLTAGIVLIAAAMSRPDAMLFYAVSIVYVLTTSRPTFRSLVLFLLPLVVIYVPYWIARYSYYGYPFPNTYYAKSANLPYYSQGIIYLWLYVKSYYVLWLVIPSAVWLFVRHFKSLKAWPIEDNRASAFLLAMFFTVPYLLYVVRSGGDFMFGRFLIPITPILFLLIELGVREALPKVKYFAPAAVVILLAVLFRLNIFAETRQISYVADEPSYYPSAWHQRAEEVGGRLREYFKGTDASFAFRGQFAVYAYYSEVPVAIEAATGLTDEFVAHQPIMKRTRPGHEKPAPNSYLVSRGIAFSIKSGIVPSNYIDSLAWIRFGDFPAYIVTFHDSLMDHLKQFPEIQFTDIRPTLDTMITQLPGLTADHVRPWYEFLKVYYFDHNVDSVRQRPFLKAVGQ
ncbi:hypothetical protein C3F09_04570 [candidate division GN15 bacterium]|uniref:Glycosyltransferase RgtA/B/C/D-like domain-containing protein n=1 Tax=candidate division GN15 bacterium TaxID=2072418 RepID=A0A855X8V0_9BACT|nr:MAG: hypothetical protein C3F09_04570 [candidate division GN15 bacterium]